MATPKGGPVNEHDDGVEASSADILTAPDSHGDPRITISRENRRALGGSSYDLAIATTHTPWLPARAAAMARLQAQIDEARVADRGAGWAAWSERAFCERMPNHVWADLMWRWAHESGRSHCLFLQDDVKLAPRALRILHAMVVAKPKPVIALHVPQPRARAVFRDRGVGWVTSSDALVGFAYLMPHDLLGDLLWWKATQVVPHAVEFTTEDSVIDAWALDRGVEIHHPLPTIVDHDLGIASTYANDKASERRPLVTWRDLVTLEGPDALHELEDPTVWDSSPVHLGRHFPKSHWVLRMMLADQARGQAAALVHDRQPFMVSPWVYP